MPKYRREKTQKQKPRLGGGGAMEGVTELVSTAAGRAHASGCQTGRPIASLLVNKSDRCAAKRLPALETSEVLLTGTGSDPRRGAGIQAGPPPTLAGCFKALSSLCYTES